MTRKKLRSNWKYLVRGGVVKLPGGRRMVLSAREVAKMLNIDNDDYLEHRTYRDYPEGKIIVGPEQAYEAYLKQRGESRE